MKLFKYMILMLWLGFSNVVAEKDKPIPKISVNPYGFKSHRVDILKVVNSAAGELWQHFPGYKLEPIVITRGYDGPIVLFKRNALKEIVVELDTEGTRWSQYSYQWAHEFCHILTGYRNDGRENKWFEETLCELASIYTMRAMAETWKTNAPYPHWKSYGPSLKKYADDVIKSREKITEKTLAQYYKKHEGELRKSSTLRDLNGAMAVVFLKWFEEKPERWEAVRYLNVRPAKDGMSFQDYMQKWHDDAPKKHQAFIKKIASAYGLKALKAKARR